MKEQLNKHLADIRSDTDKQLAAIDDAYNKRPDDQKTEQARTDRDKAKQTAEQNRDREIDAAYVTAASEIQDAEAINGIGLFDTFSDYELGMLNQVVLGVRTGNWLGDWRRGRCGSARFSSLPRPGRCAITPSFSRSSSCSSCACGRSSAGRSPASPRCMWRTMRRSPSARRCDSPPASSSASSRPRSSRCSSWLRSGLVIAVGGLLGNIPFVGPIVVGVLFFLALVAGFVMTLVLLGTAGGFNLMYPDDRRRRLRQLRRHLPQLQLSLRPPVADGVLQRGRDPLRLDLLPLRALLHLPDAGADAQLRRPVHLPARRQRGAPLERRCGRAPPAVGWLTYDVNYLALGAGAEGRRVPDHDLGLPGDRHAGRSSR